MKVFDVVRIEEVTLPPQERSPRQFLADGEVQRDRGAEDVGIPVGPGRCIVATGMAGDGQASVSIHE